MLVDYLIMTGSIIFLTFLNKQQFDRLSEQEKQEIDFYAELDDYLSLVNRTMRNIAWAEKPSPI
jgi:hypothetical protein